jgi:hypothetical protein
MAFMQQGWRQADAQRSSIAGGAGKRRKKQRHQGYEFTSLHPLSSL